MTRPPLPLPDLATRATRAIEGLRARLGAKRSVALLLLPPAAFGIAHFGPRAALVLAVAVGVTLAAGIIPRVIAREPWERLHPGSLVTGLIFGLLLTDETPLYMVVAGALTAALPGKAALGRLGRNPLNPAVLGRAAVALLETIDAPVRAAAAAGADIVTSASVLAKDAGGHAPPETWALVAGLTRGAIGQTSALVLVPALVLALRFVVLKREAALAMLATVPLLAALLPPTPELVGHAPWALDPAIFLLGSSTLFLSAFIATDPVTTPGTRLGGAIFGAGAAAALVLGRYYTSVPGAETYGVLLLNALAAPLDRLIRRARPSPPSPARDPVASFYARADGAEGAAPLPPAYAEAEGVLPTDGEPPFAALRAALHARDRRAILEAVRASGLKGCGGAEFPVARKWDAALSHPAPRVLVANGQEGDPETFKDRWLMRRAPRAVAEGIGLAALALEADEVHVVVDPDAADARAALEAALAELRAALGPGALPAVRVVAGSGLYVTGEETALLEHLEGRRGEPRARPPFPAERGLGGRSTVVENVESLAWIPAILRRGPAWFAGPRGGGRRLLSISGAVRRPGVYEVEIGTPIERAIERAGGAVSGPGAVAVGGVSGAILPPSLLGLPLEREALRGAGAALGTGALRVIAASACPVAEALPSARFFARETCGRCTPCRVGTGELARLWGGLSEGRGRPEEIEQVGAIASALQAAANCGLGSAAPGRLLSVLRHFPDEVRTRLADEGRRAGAGDGEGRMPCRATNSSSS